MLRLLLWGLVRFAAIGLSQDPNFSLRSGSPMCHAAVAPLAPENLFFAPLSIVTAIAPPSCLAVGYLQVNVASG